MVKYMSYAIKALLSVQTLISLYIRVKVYHPFSYNNLRNPPNLCNANITPWVDCAGAQGNKNYTSLCVYKGYHFRARSNKTNDTVNYISYN